MAAFGDEELTTFCYDNFRAVYEEFTTGMSRTQKAQRLVETCDRRGEIRQIAGAGGASQSVPVQPIQRSSAQYSPVIAVVTIMSVHLQFAALACLSSPS